MQDADTPEDATNEGERFERSTRRLHHEVALCTSATIAERNHAVGADGCRQSGAIGRTDRPSVVGEMRWPNVGTGRTGDSEDHLLLRLGPDDFEPSLPAGSHLGGRHQ